VSARVSAAERAALPVARAALESQGSAYGVSDAIVFALGAAGLLMSPDVAAEFEQAKTDARRYRIAWRMAYQRAMGRGWAADRAGARVHELLPAVQEATFGRIGMQVGRDAALARVAELEAERHSTNEALDSAVQAIRTKDQRIAELEAELRIGPPWKCYVCGKDNRRDVCVICETDRPDAAEAAPGAVTAGGES
jgi:hypothetical protein